MRTPGFWKKLQGGAWGHEGPVQPAGRVSSREGGCRGGDAARLAGGGVVFGGGGTKGFKFLDSRPPHSIHTSPTLQAGLSQVPGSTPRPKCS